MAESEVGRVSNAIEKSIVWQGGFDDTVQNTVDEELRVDSLWRDSAVVTGIANSIEYAIPDMFNKMQFADPRLVEPDFSIVDAMRNAPETALVGNYLAQSFNAIDTSNNGILDSREMDMWDYGLNRHIPDATVSGPEGKFEWTTGGQTAVFDYTPSGEIVAITQSGANPKHFVKDSNTGNWTDSRGIQYGPIEIIPYEQTDGNGQTTFEPVQFSAQILSGSNKGGWILHKADNSEVVSNENLQIRSIRYPNGDQRLFFYDQGQELAAVKFVDANGGDHTTDISDGHPQLYRDGTLIVTSGTTSTVYLTNGETRVVDAVSGQPEIKT